ncbi:SMC family ATPase [Salinactinospora qingdaonensis]|uniref:Nuclease SbcCD subunit C n=1 Tax=Salinactinospora qingdaonensis TaxID=702744 RepID=A0ABP7FBK4_9ACTN
MRLHRLTMQAFGPFADTVSVDFDALADGGLFLIHGPTGAGKTSVLDAVCFALYGQVPGAREGAKSPRSNHAPPDRAPEVRLETTIAGRRLHIVRCPSWERPKKRGKGMTKENAQLALSEWVAGEWRGVTNRIDEAADFIDELLGLSREQFCQIVLLPQGEFARFLRAGAAERRASLERLFATGMFTKLEKWLAEHARDRGRAAAEAERAVTQTADQIAERAGQPAVTGAEEPEELEPWARELAAVTTATAADAAALAAEMGRERDLARTALEQARSLVQQQERYAAALRQRDELDERAAERHAIEAELAAAGRAAEVAALLQAAEQRRVDAQKTRLDAVEKCGLAGTLLALDDLGLPAQMSSLPDEATGQEPETAFARLARDSAETARARLTAAARQRHDETAQLEQRRADADWLRLLEEQLQQVATEVDTTKEELDRVSAEAAKLPERRAELAAKLEETRERSGPRETALEACETARRRLTAAREVQRLDEAVATAHAAHSAAVDTAQQARDHYQSVREQRISGMAAELAAALTPEHPCPVCGSTEHPHPAVAAADQPSPEDEEAAQRDMEAAQQRRDEAKDTLTSLTEQRAAEERTAEGLTIEEAEARLRAREDELAALDTANEEVQRLSDEIIDLDDKHDEARRQESELTARLAECRQRHRDREQERDRLTESLAQARGDDPDLGSRIDRLTSEAELLEDAAEALRSWTTATEELTAAEHEATTGLERAGFTDAEQARAAARTTSEREELTRRAREYDDARAAAQAELGDPDLIAASRQPAPDLAVLEGEVAAAEHSAECFLGWHKQIADRAHRLAELRVKLKQRLAASRPAREHHQVAERLARLAAGTSAENRENVQLSAYVLAARLEQVVAAANDRLGDMSGGRYELRHTIDKSASDGRKVSSGGLGLRVIDAWTGQERDPATLSGGETFITSLALALGLADVAGEEAGGADIGTLFVDEGFGTLDEDTLDEVLEVLDHLREGGRTVGVVSHVADLRTRIPTRLRVVKTTHGSHLEQTT